MKSAKNNRASAKVRKKMPFEAADSETKRIVSEISNHSLSEAVFRVRIESNYRRTDLDSNRSHISEQGTLRDSISIRQNVSLWDESGTS